MQCTRKRLLDHSLTLRGCWISQFGIEFEMFCLVAQRRQLRPLDPCPEPGLPPSQSLLLLLPPVCLHQSIDLVKHFWRQPGNGTWNATVKFQLPAAEKLSNSELYNFNGTKRYINGIRWFSALLLYSPDQPLWLWSGAVVTASAAAVQTSVAVVIRGNYSTFSYWANTGWHNSFGVGSECLPQSKYFTWRGLLLVN